MNKNPKQDLDHYVYDDSQSEALHRSTEQHLRENIQQSAKRDAEQNLPQPTGDSFSHYISPELNGIQQYVEKLRALHRADESVYKTIEKHEKEANNIRNVRDELKAKVREVKSQLARINSNYPTLVAILIALLVLLLGFMEGVMGISAIRVVIPSFYLALPISLVFGLGWAIIAHQFLKWYSSGDTRFVRLIRRIALIVGSSTAFFALGILRSYHVHLSTLEVEQTSVGGILQLADPQEAFIYCLLSWVVFIPAVLLSKHTPSRQEWFAIFKKNTLLKKINALETEVSSAETEVNRLTTEVENLKIWDESRMKTAKRYEQGAVKMIPYLKSLYIQTNLRYRNDKKRPDCFDKDFKFYLTLYFQSDESPTDSNSNNHNS